LQILYFTPVWENIQPRCDEENMKRKDMANWSLATFSVPAGYRGRSALVVLLWDFVNFVVFSNTPKPLYFLRSYILRAFGAKIGRGVQIRPTARICYPWKLEIGDYSWIGDYVDLYNLEPIRIGSNSIISQYSKVITGSHDYTSEDFRYRNAPIRIGDNVWISIDCLLLPGAIVPGHSFFSPRSIIRAEPPLEHSTYWWGSQRPNSQRS
jgi:putative colanic acid biosynthesis acetyltransferase WcaF